KVKRQQRRRAAGIRPRHEYEANSLSKTQPWKELGMSRRTWERHRNKRDASVSAAYLLTAQDRLATTQQADREVGNSCGATPRQEEKRTSVLSAQTARPKAVDIHGSLPIELRLLALGLPMPENMARAA